MSEQTKEELYLIILEDGSLSTTNRLVDYHLQQVEDGTLSIVRQSDMNELDVTVDGDTGFFKETWRKLEEDNSPDVEPEDCSECSKEDNGVEYEKDFRWENDTWVCNNCNRPQ